LPHKLQPHSQEWFDRFKRINPLQAELTSRLVERAGHGDICTTCGGDLPNADFLLQYITLRLCNPCQEIYSRTYGEKLICLGQVKNVIVKPATADDDCGDLATRMASGKPRKG
jgi:hypothetical protein